MSWHMNIFGKAYARYGNGTILVNGWPYVALSKKFPFVGASTAGSSYV